MLVDLSSQFKLPKKQPTYQPYQSTCKPKPLRVPSMNTLHACGRGVMEGMDADQYRHTLLVHVLHVRSDDSLATLDWWCVVLRRLNVAQPAGQLSIKGPPYVQRRITTRVSTWFGLGRRASLVCCELAWLVRTVGGVPRARVRRCSSTIAHDRKRGPHQF